MSCVEEAVCRERQRVQEERFARDRERLEKGEEKIDTIEKAVIYLTEQSRNDHESIQDHSRRLNTLEHRPGALLDKLIVAGLSAGVSGLVTIVINLLF